MTKNFQVEFIIGPIGYVRKGSHFKNKDQTLSKDYLDILPEFREGLNQLEHFSHIILLWWADRNDKTDLRKIHLGRPRGDPNAPHSGTFAKRSPRRPNPICLTVLEIRRIQENTITVRSFEAFENTPILDIKPYLPSGDSVLNTTLPDWFADLREPRE